MSDLTKSKKYNQGIEDARDGFPMNRFMRNDHEYIAGYEHVTEDSKEALSGARKVNSLGSVRGDEHLGAMLPDEAIFDARKVEP
jgi:hypothetical protein